MAQRLTAPSRSTDPLDIVRQTPNSRDEGRESRPCGSGQMAEKGWERWNVRSTSAWAGSIRLPLSSRIFAIGWRRSEEHTSELQSLTNLVCRLLLEKKKKN